jgi:hypothetical protein
MLPQLLHIHLFICHKQNIFLASSSIVKWISSLFLEIWFLKVGTHVSKTVQLRCVQSLSMSSGTVPCPLAHCILCYCPVALYRVHLHTAFFVIVQWHCTVSTCTLHYLSMSSGTVPCPLAHCILCYCPVALSRVHLHTAFFVNVQWHCAVSTCTLHSLSMSSGTVPCRLAHCILCYCPVALFRVQCAPPVLRMTKTFSEKFV